MLPAERVLSEMRSLGIVGTELGAPGFLPDDTGALRLLLSRYEIELVGAFVPLVLHDPTHRDATVEQARRTASKLRACGATRFVSAAVVDEQWSPRRPLSDDEWDHVVGMLDELDGVTSEHGLVHALHPHVGTLVEQADEVARLLEQSSVRWCLDTGHLAIGGYDPMQFANDAAERVVHVHLKDVRLDVAEKVHRGELSLMHGVHRGLFCPLGRGGAPIREVVVALEGSGYQGWYVLEQDTALTGDEPAPGTGPVDDVRDSVAYLRVLLEGELAR
jgi:inosose dehydratase